MSFENKKYIDLLNDDFSEFINCKEDAEEFEKMMYHMHRTVGVPVAECVHDVIAVINIGNKLKGLKQRAFFQAGPGLN